MIKKIKGLINITKKSNNLIIGIDNILNTKKKIFLVLKSKNLGVNSLKQIEKKFKDENVITYEENEIIELIGIPNCKVVGIANEGLANSIKKYEVKFDK